jgi:hypothetical protein
MSADDVTYNTLGFTGAIGNSNRTFTLHFDNTSKTGSKSYTVYTKNLTGSRKLILSTGVSGASDLELPSGNNVAGVYVDENGSVKLNSMTPTNLIQTGNIAPATSGAVAEAVNNLIKTKDVTIYFNELSWNDYSASGGGFYANSHLSNYVTGYSKMLTVIATQWSQIDCRGCYVCMDDDATALSFIVETHPSNGRIKVRFIYI